MISSKGVLAVITARGGSKGLKQKNILSLGGMPLIGWTIRAALDSKCIDRVIVSTDDEQIADVALKFGAEVPFLRPGHLASDTAKSADVMAHALKNIPGYEYAALLQPTSPFRTAADLDAGFELWQRMPEVGGCVSVCQSMESPWHMYSFDNSNSLTPIIPTSETGQRRQDLPKAFLLNGAFYFFKINRFWTERRLIFADSLGFEMPMDRSIDIDTLEDLTAARKQLTSWSGIIPNIDN